MKKALLTAIVGGFAGIAFTQTVLTHSTQHNVQSGNSAACTTTGVVSNNYFIRKFDLNDYPNITDTAFVIMVYTGVESTVGGPYKVRGAVYELNGALNFSNMTLIAEDTADVFPDSSLYYLDIPINNGYILPGMEVVTELYTPIDAVVNFFPGSNFYFETDTSYIAAPSCGLPQPVSFASVGFASTHLILDLYVNQRPQMSSFTVFGLKDYNFNFSKSDFTLNYNDNDNDTLHGIVVHTLPAYGDLYSYGNLVAIYDTLWAGQLDSLIYIPDPGYYGTDVFAIQARDEFHSSNGLEIVTIDLMNWIVGVDEVSEQNLLIYPNPVSDQLCFKGDFAGASVLVMDASGRIVLTSSLLSNQLDVSGLSSGSYMAILVKDGQLYKEKFLKN